MRLDEFLVFKKIAKSRNLAKQYIINNLVEINKEIINKPSFIIDINQQYDIRILEPMKFVSRAGYKLEAALKMFDIDCNNKTVLDIGASTGGFSDCCLQNHCKKIFCVDVGSNQLDKKILMNNKVINLQNLNVKNLNKNLINEPIDMIVSDLSFISSKYMFEAINNINLNNNAILITLIKPQFELDSTIVKNQNYNIKNKKYIDLAINNVKSYASNHHWIIKDIIPSPIKGAKKENQEYLMWCIKNG